MARYPLNLPSTLKQDAERLASSQGVSLNQFILWAVAEKVGALGRTLDDPAFPLVTYRRGGGGFLSPVIRGTGIHIETIAAAITHWGMSADQIAEQWNLTPEQVREGLAFYASHRAEIDSSIAADSALEEAHGQAPAAFG